MRCAYLTFERAENDHNIWSGLNFHIRQALVAAGFEVEHFGNLTTPIPFPLRVRNWFYRRVAKQGFHHQRTKMYLRKTGRATSHRIAAAGHFDFLFAPSTYPITGLSLNIPKFAWLDATFAGMLDYYFDFKNLSKSLIRDGVATESCALQECAGVFFSSEWAAKLALSRCHLEPHRTHVIPFGANIEAVYPDVTTAEAAIHRRTAPPYKFLFAGVDWERKGGVFAVGVIEKLNANGIPAKLTIVGSKPDISPRHDFIENVGFLDKTKPEQLARFRHLFSEAHFLILPTRAEAYGLVFAEAAAYAVPTLAMDTGGISTVVKNGQTGLLFNLNDTSTQWAERIARTLKNYGEYFRMSLAAYERYQTLLNWKVASQRLREIIISTLAK